MNTFSLFSDFKSLKTVNLFLEVFSHLRAYNLLINSWLYVQFEVDRMNYLTEKEINWFLPAAHVYHFPQKIENKLGDRMINQLLNSVIAKYRDLSVASRSIICRLRQIIENFVVLWTSVLLAFLTTSRLFDDLPTICHVIFSSWREVVGFMFWIFRRCNW